MANSERATRNFNTLIRSKENQINSIKRLSTTIDFISDVEASKLMGVEYGVFRKMVEDAEVISYTNELLTFIPTFQFNESNEVSDLFKELLGKVSDDVKGKSSSYRNIVLRGLLKYFDVLHQNEFGGESTTKLRGFEYIKRFSFVGVYRVAKEIHQMIHPQMGM